MIIWMCVLLYLNWHIEMGVKRYTNWYFYRWGRKHFRETSMTCDKLLRTKMLWLWSTYYPQEEWIHLSITRPKCLLAVHALFGLPFSCQVPGLLSYHVHCIVHCSSWNKKDKNDDFHSKPHSYLILSFNAHWNTLLINLNLEFRRPWPWHLTIIWTINNQQAISSVSFW